MHTLCFCALAALAVSGCGGRIHDPHGSASTSDAGTVGNHTGNAGSGAGNAGSDAGASGGNAGDASTATKHCTFKGFAPAVSYTPRHEPLWVTAVDSTGTSNLDLAIGERGQTVTDFSCELFANAGDGTFTSQPSFGSSDNFCGNLVSADFDGDGKADVASQLNPTTDSDAGSGVLNLDFGVAQHEFAPTLTAYPMPFADSELVVADFNRDGRPDIAAAGDDFELPPLQGVGLRGPVETNFTLAVMLNAGTGALGAPVLYPSPHRLSQLTAADFDGDGWLDLAALSNTSLGGFDVYLNAGDGTFRDPKTFPGADLWSSFGIGVADFNGDGKADIASAAILDANLASEQKVLQIFSGRSDGSFDGPANYAMPNIPSIDRVFTGDFNGDRQADVAMVLGSDAQGARINPIPIAVFLNQGDGTFAPPTNYYVGDAMPGYAISLAVGELNGDGVTDIAVTTAADFAPYGVAVNVLLSECE